MDRLAVKIGGGGGSSELGVIPPLRNVYGNKINKSDYSSLPRPRKFCTLQTSGFLNIYTT